MLSKEETEGMFYLRKSGLAWRPNGGWRGSRIVMPFCWRLSIDSLLSQLTPSFCCPHQPLHPVLPYMSTPTAALGILDRVSGLRQGIRKGGRRVSLTGAQHQAEHLPSCFSSWFCQVLQALLPHPICQPQYTLVSLVVTVGLSTLMCVYAADSFRRSNKKGTVNDGSCSPDYSLACVDLKSFKNNLVDIIQQNKERWKELAAQGMKPLWSLTATSLCLISCEILDFSLLVLCFNKICKPLVGFGI